MLSEKHSSGSEVVLVLWQKHWSGSKVVLVLWQKHSSGSEVVLVLWQKHWIGSKVVLALCQKHSGGSIVVLVLLQKTWLSIVTSSIRWQKPYESPPIRCLQVNALASLVGGFTLCETPLVPLSNLLVPIQTSTDCGVPPLSP